MIVRRIAQGAARVPGVAVVGLGLITLAAYAFSRAVPYSPATVAWVYLPVALWVTLRFGRAAGVVTALVAGLLILVFAVPPYGLPWAQDGGDLLRTVVSAAGMLFVALLVDGMNRRRVEAERRLAVEEERAESENRLTRLADANMIGVVYWNDSGGITYANRAFLRMTGYTSADLRAGSIDWRRMTPPEYAEGDARALAELAATGNAPPIEKEFFRKDGSRVPVIVGAVTMPESRTDGVACVLDTSEHRRAEAALRESEARYRRILDTAQEGIWLRDAAGRTTYANQRLAEILGYHSPDEVIGRHVLDFMFDEDRAEAQQIFERRSRGVAEVYDLRLRRTDGRPVWALVSSNPVLDDAGTVVGALGMVTDVSERRQIEEDRRRALLSEQAARAAAEDAAARTTRLQELTAALADARTVGQVAAVMVDLGLAAVQADAGSLALLSDDGHTIEIVRAAGYPAGVVEAYHTVSIDMDVPIAQAIRSGEPVWVDADPDRSGHYAMLADVTRRLGPRALASIPLVIEGRAIGAFNMSFSEGIALTRIDRDYILAVARQCAPAIERARLTEAERAARTDAEAALRVRDEFVASVSHDLKTPLTTIKGHTQLLLRLIGRELIDQRRLTDALTAIDATTTRMTSMVAELVDVSRLQTGRPLELTRAPVDLVSLARAAAADHQRTTEYHQVRVESEVDELVGLWDAGRLERVLSNLLSNAIRYSPEGGPVTIRLGREDGADGHAWAWLSVEDQGLGIPAADLTRVFERFHRGANVAGLIGGAGIGLAGSKQIIEQHGGVITVASIQGEGTTFTLRLPLPPPVIDAAR
jgi:PAS domain S-box-containing protein